VARHSKLRLYAHFVFVTEQRLPFISPSIERRLYHYISRVCQDDGCDVLAIGGTENHVHLLVNMGHKASAGTLMHHVKGGSSRLMGQILGPEAPFKWQRGYGVLGVSPHDKERVIAYILKQKEHHRAGTIWPAVEGIEDEADDGGETDSATSSNHDTER
jgi:putative transposase